MGEMLIPKGEMFLVPRITFPRGDGKSSTCMEQVLKYLHAVGTVGWLNLEQARTVCALQKENADAVVGPLHEKWCEQHDKALGVING